MEYTSKIRNFSNLLVLISCFDHFSVLQDVKTPEDYGKFLARQKIDLNYEDELCFFVDFHAFGEKMASRERGVFTEAGYLKYAGYSQEMAEILAESIGYTPRNAVTSTKLKLFMPVLVENITAEEENTIVSLEGKMLVEVTEYLQNLLGEYQQGMVDPRGFMGQYFSQDSLNAKVERYTFDVGNLQNELIGVVNLDLNEELTTEEMQRMKQVIGGQAAGAVNKLLHENTIQREEGIFKVSLWNSSCWFLKTAEELGI